MTVPRARWQSPENDPKTRWTSPRPGAWYRILHYTRIRPITHCPSSHCSFVPLAHCPMFIYIYIHTPVLQYVHYRVLDIGIGIEIDTIPTSKKIIYFVYLSVTYLRLRYLIHRKLKFVQRQRKKDTAMAHRRTGTQAHRGMDGETRSKRRCMEYIETLDIISNTIRNRYAPCTIVQLPSIKNCICRHNIIHFWQFIQSLPVYHTWYLVLGTYIYIYTHSRRK